MKQTILIIGLILFCIVTGATAGVGYMHRQQSRYYIQASGDGFAYKIDRQTGQTWMIFQGRMATLGESEDHEEALEEIRGRMRLGSSEQ